MKRYCLDDNSLSGIAAHDDGDFVFYADALKESAELRGKLSLAEEGLANYAQEVERLQRALCFWLPGVPMNGPEEIAQRIGDDAHLLASLKVADEKDAEELGWITLNAAPQTAPIDTVTGND